MLFQLRRIAARNDGDDDAALLHHAIGTCERVTPDRIEDKIDIMRDVFEFLFRVIDRNIGAELLE